MTQVQSLSPDGVPAQQGGTPLPLPAEQTADALETIEFGPVLELVAAHAVGPLGAARLRGRRPTDDLVWIREELVRAGEIAGLFRRGDGLLAEPIPDVTRTLARLRIEGSVLEGMELAALQRTLAAARAIHADLHRVAESAPAAASLARPLPDRAIERRLEQSVDSDGNLLDTASPRLAAARREVQAARQRLLRRLDALLRGLESGSAPSDAAVTVRGNRYVIPVRRDSRSRPPGIIHDESGSAGTLFIEPSETIELGNALREAQVEEERETLRVLRELTDLLRPNLSLLRDAVEMCVAVDDLVARARYAVATTGEVPEVAPAPAELRIVNGRHPLLLAGTSPVVPFDLELTAEERTLLVSGPNTGGKTVLLKAVGLAAALAGSGIIPPVGQGSKVPIFRRFFADIGDRQSIAASLSTFSAHVRMVRRVLEEADDESLVLLDEIGSGTDPVEGAALAAATLVSLTGRGSVTLATTHLGALKDLASQTGGVVNASLQFDAATLTPTYRLLKGVPGRSYGLAIARRLGVAGEILADAESRVPDAERRLDALLAAVEEREGEMRLAHGALEERGVELDSLAARLNVQQEAQTARESELKRREKEAEREGRKQARAYLLEARQRVEEALAAARGAVDETAAREARRVVEEGIVAEGEWLAGQRGSGAAGQGETPEEIAPGSRVRLEGGGAGEVAEIRADGKVVVSVGAIRVVTDPGNLTVVSAREERRARTQTAPLSSSPSAHGAPAPLEIDLRGMTGDEAETATVAAVDAAVLAEQPYLRIIHGMGTGVVRERVRRIVSRDRRIARYAFAPRNQGGTGVTIVEFSA
ncbi:MAG TPA: Smr/MutS family protein [Gemmatimonadales bacterium]|jgi:DNA mismatch repair protein MutS2|nr:Smr/MutS family protein [Gemmatimonadales bacterium]